MADTTKAEGPDEGVIRFRLEVPDSSATLDDYYRGSLRDLLSVVRLTHRGRRVLVDGFTFIGAPDRVICILTESKTKDREGQG